MPPSRLQPGDVVEVGPALVRLRVNPRARRLTLSVSGGQVTATAPSARRLREVLEFARTRSDWIAAQMAAAPPPQPFVPGAFTPLRGELMPLRAVPGRGAARLAGGAIVSGGEGEAFSRRVTNLLKREALQDFRTRTHAHAAALGKPAPQVSVFDASGRWGSCTPARRTIRYSWRVVAAPPWVLDYLAAHECAHLVEPNHSPRFWALVKHLYGEPGPARAWFRTHGPALQALGRQPVAPAAT
jgi:hypothetical protein